MSHHAIGPHGVIPRTAVLNTNSAEYTKSAGVTTRYRAAENPWGRGSLVRGVDFTDTVTINLAGFPSGVQFDWSWPVPGTGAVMSFPFNSLETSPTPYPQISSLTTIQSTHNFSYTFNGQSLVQYDTWLFSDSGGSTIAFEIQYFIATRGYGSSKVQPIRNHSEPYISLASPQVDVYQITGGGWPRLFVYPATTQTNKFDNPTMSGSTNGTPGTPPTHIKINNNNSPAISTSIVSSGSRSAADGTTVNYTRFRINGTPTATTNIGIEVDDPSGTYFAWDPVADGFGFVSAYLSVTAGSTSNISPLQLGINEYDSGFGYISTTGGLSFTSTLTGSPQHFGLQYVPTSASVARIQPQLLFWITNGSAIDITIEIGNVVVSKDVTQNAPSQTFDWKALFNQLVTAGIMTGSEYLQTIQIGPEIVNGAGTVTLGNYSVTQS